MWHRTTSQSSLHNPLIDLGNVIVFKISYNAQTLKETLAGFCVYVPWISYLLHTYLMPNAKRYQIRYESAKPKYAMDVK